jgi:hypothetical protein
MNRLDDKGYERQGHSTLIHRQIAYREIYLKNRNIYPLPFSKYIIHHKDLNKKNNSIDNLQIVTKEEHNKIHGITSDSTLSRRKKLILFWTITIIVTSPFWITALIVLIRILFGIFN